ncbi:hypothetical protein HMPREF9370_1463 [Neisseria wadsworthii 9715]|uniref:Uncharacterized protein n=1 Tax=Neisseria wadsworthii 9715 TaxID=1030841 RepID=G4CQV3_9NEIS|nr:hypothetical protein HMPREF9370_1463 [Neisseria wadsworthii 9715]
MGIIAQRESVCQAAAIGLGRLKSFRRPCLMKYRIKLSVGELLKLIKIKLRVSEKNI